MEKEPNFRFRDLLAMPFWLVAMMLDWCAVIIGGKWTSKMYID